LLRRIPAAADFAVGVPAALAAAAVLGGLAVRLRAGRDLAAAYTRKLFHIGIFSIAAGVHAFRGAPAVIVYGSAVARRSYMPSSTGAATGRTTGWPERATRRTASRSSLFH